MIPFKKFRLKLPRKLIPKGLPKSKIADRPVGDCFRTSCKMLHDDLANVPHARLVHAFVNGTGPLRGKRIEHGWVELGDVVFDYSGGKRRVMRKEHYYNLGGVRKVPGEYASYDHEEANKKLLQHQHWGPWDLKDGE